MLNAQNYIGLVCEKGKSQKLLKGVYRQMLQRDFFINGYGKLYPNKGALTKGPNDETVQGMSIEKIDLIIERLKEQTFLWQPSRRVRIPKQNSTQIRSLGLPTWTDKLVQEVIRVILEAYYEQIFSDLSHGFRPNRGCHTALQEIKKWKGTVWFIEGDIKGCFDNIDHNLMLSILAENIRDLRLQKLIGKMLKAGYMDNWIYHQTYSGTPQGGVISPLLSNILLNKLDQFLMRVIIPQYTQGKKRKTNREYRRMESAIQAAKRKGNKEEVKELTKRLRQLPSVDPFDSGFCRVKYARYADDFLLGIIGSKQTAIEIKRKIGEFLSQELKLEISQEKTLITHARSQKARFLGYDIYTAWANSRITKGKDGKKRRSTNGCVQLGVPNEVIQEWTNKFKGTNGKTIHRAELINHSDLEIIKIYQAEFQGLVNYYKISVKLLHLYKLKYHYQESLVKTLATKYKISVKSVYAKYKIKSKHGITAIEATIPNPNKPGQVYRATFGGNPIRYKKITAINDLKPNVYKYYGRNELGRRLVANVCEIEGCNSSDRIQGHHINSVKELKKKYKDKKDLPTWIIFMMTRNRKTIFVCHKHHQEITHGQYNGPKITGKH